MKTLLMSPALTALSVELHSQEAATKVRALVHVQGDAKRPKHIRATAKLLVVESTIKEVHPGAQKCAEELITIQRTLMALGETPAELPQGKHFRWPRQLHPLTLSADADYRIDALRNAEAEKIAMLATGDVFREVPVLKVVGPTTVSADGRDVHVPRDVFPALEGQVAIEDVLVLELRFHRGVEGLLNPMSWELGRPVLTSKAQKRLRDYELVSKGDGIPAIVNVTGKCLALAALCCADIGNQGVKAVAFGFRFGMAWKDGADPSPDRVFEIVAAMREIEDLPAAVDETLELIQRKAETVTPGRRAWLQAMLVEVCLGEDHPGGSLNHAALAAIVEEVMDTMIDDDTTAAGTRRLLSMIPLLAYQGFAEGLADDESANAWLQALVGANPFAPSVITQIRTRGGEAPVVAEAEVEEVLDEVEEPSLGDLAFYEGLVPADDTAMAVSASAIMDHSVQMGEVLATALAKADDAMLTTGEPVVDCVEELADMMPAR